MSDVLRQTDSQQTTGTPDDHAAARDARSDAPAAAGQAPGTASGAAASPVQRPGGPDREPGDVMYGTGDMEETDEENADMEDTDLERAGMERADLGAADLHAADMEPAASMEPRQGTETGGAYPGPGTETAGATHPGPGTDTAGATHPGPGTTTPMEPGAASVADTALVADAAQVHQRWQQIQATFVDDPRGSVEHAAMLAEEVLNNLMAAGQQRVTDLRNEWVGNGTDTELLRNALRRYRMFIDQLAGM